MINQLLDLDNDSHSTNKTSVCLFCEHVERKVGRRRAYLTFPQYEATVQGIKAIAEKLNDNEIFQRLVDYEPIAYHSNCLSVYHMSVKRKLRNVHTQHIGIKIDSCIN